MKETKINAKVENIYNSMNVLIYDDENIKYYHCVPTMINVEPNIVSSESISGYISDIVLSHDINIQTPRIEENDSIKLDDTLMKRIAKFNKEQECLKLDKQIEEKKKQIKEIEEVLNDRTKRLKKLKDYICDIYNIDIDNDDDYYDYD